MIYEDLSWIFLEWRRYQQRRLQPFGITIQQYSLMREISKSGSMCANQAADFLHCDAPTLSVIISNLRKKGLIDRIMDENDRRKCRIIITETGIAELKRIRKEIAPLNSRPFDCLTTEQQSQLSDMLAAGRVHLANILNEEK